MTATIFAGCRVIEQIYQSNRTLIQRARRSVDERPVILKRLRTAIRTPDEITQFKREYEITHSMALPGVITAYSLANEQDQWLMILEDFGGISLDQLKTQSGSRTPWNFQNPKDFLELAIQVSESLGQLHRSNLIHQDINPSNILLNPQTGQVKLIDLGFARPLTPAPPFHPHPPHLAGTPAYLSPEQTGRTQQAVDQRTDLYALGATLYELLTGQTPFRAADPVELVHAHIALQAPHPKTINPRIPDILAEIVLKLLAKDVRDRYQSALGLKADLEECLHRLQPSSPASANAPGIDAFALGKRDLANRFQLPHKLYGREAEIKTLQAALQRATAMNKSAETEFVLVTGVSGIGKTMLVRQVCQPATHQGHYFIAGKFDPPQQAIPYAAFIQALTPLIRQVLTQSEVQVADWRARLLRILGPDIRVISRVMPDLELLMGPQTSIDDPPTMDGQIRFVQAICNLVRIFASVELPLVILLDDLQWADPASLNLLQSLVTDPQDQHMLIIGTCREYDNETDKDAVIPKPLFATLSDIERAGKPIRHIELQPLARPQIEQFIADTLHDTPEQVRPLAEVVQAKTGGNLFFAGEFMKSLHAAGWVAFDAQQGNWVWHLERIQAQGVTANVADLLVHQVERLPVETQQILKRAACLGTRFALQTLAVIDARPQPQVRDSLQPALDTGLIVARPPDAQYQFSHDRIRQAVYSLISATDLAAAHGAIGQQLRQHLPPAEAEERLFEIVNHLNLGRSLIAEQAGRDELAELNVRAGYKAADLAAYAQLFDYFEISLELCSPLIGGKQAREQAWRQRYDHLLNLHIVAAQAAYYSGNNAEVARLTDLILQYAQTQTDQVKAYQIKIDLHIARDEPVLALTNARHALSLLDINLPEKPGALRVFLGLLQTQWVIAWALRGRRIENLADWPEMRDVHKLAAMQVLSSAGIAASMLGSDLSALFNFEQVKMSLTCGHSTWAAQAYASYGAILCILGQIKVGARWGRVAGKLAEQFREIGNDRVLALFTIGTYIEHWQMHIRDTLGTLRAAFKSREIHYISSSVGLYAYHAYFIQNQDLAAVEQDMASLYPVFVQAGHASLLHRHQLGWQFCLNLLGDGQDPGILTGDAYDEQKQLPQHLQAGDRNLVFHLYLFKLVLCYIFQVFDQAVINADLADRDLQAAQGTPLVPVFYFYDSLARLAVCPQAAPAERKRILRRVKANQKKMKTWAGHGPANCLHKWQLVEAERARISGRFGQAREGYDQAIALTRQYDYVNEEAVACECAARFYLNREQPQLAQVYLDGAHKAYTRWGATGKLRALAARYPTISPTGTARYNLDLLSVMEASQVISRELTLDKLLTRLIQIVIQNAGAETGLLILRKQGQWRIEAAGWADKNQAQVLHSAPLNERMVAESIVNYVTRTREAVVLEDAVRAGPFTRDEAIRERQSKSILCVPLLNQGQLMGMFYLENNLTTGAFTTERLQVIEVLATRAAISIENARLYTDLEQRVAERTASLLQANLRLEQESRERQQAEQALIQQHRATAMLEERERLARELHDSLSQVLGFVNLQAQAARTLLATDQVEQGDQTLSRLVQVVQEAQVDVWEYILGAKTAVALEQGFILTLSQYLEQFEQDHDFQVTLTLPDELTDEAFEFPVQIQLLRIIQEALNNIRKHAGIQAARVIFEKQARWLQVTIEDDGRGFNLPADGTQSASGQHFGLRVMRERAAEVGGSLQIQSAPGAGTRLVLCFPGVNLAPTALDGQEES